MKICTKCKIEKSKNKFSKKSKSKDGLSYWCRECSSLEKKVWDENNKEQKRYRSKIWNDNNVERVKDNKRNYKENNKEKIKNDNKTWQQVNPNKIHTNNKKYRINNPDKMNAAHAKYRAAKLDATPDTLTEEDWNKIDEFYRESQRLSKETNTLSLSVAT